MAEDQQDRRAENEDNLGIAEAFPVDEHVEEDHEHGGERLQKGVYLIPNLITTGALFGGFFAIIAAMNGDFAKAAMAIFAAQVLDGMDGRVARMTNSTSRFGSEYDSLSDMVSFGLAPAIVLFSWGLEPLGKYGWAAAFVFVACAALRLARFNTRADIADNRFFVGLASPPAATLMASGVWLGSEMELTSELSVFAAIVTALVGFLMVSNIQYQSFKGFDTSRRVPFVAMLVVMAIFVIITINPPAMLFSLAFCYALSGPFVWLLKSCRHLLKKVRDESTQTAQSDKDSSE